MFRNYFKIAWRTIIRSRQATLINVCGLALGLAVFLLISEYVAFELNANSFHKAYNQLYRVNTLDKKGTSENILPPGYAPLLKANITGIEEYVRVVDGIGAGVITYAGSNGTGQKILRESKLVYVDASFLQVFTFPLVAGTPFLPGNTLALSEHMSQKLFSTQNPIGKTVVISNQFGNTTYTVNAVYKDMPENSDIRSDVLLSLATLNSAANRNDNGWADPSGLESGFSSIFLLLKKGTDQQKVAQEITKYVQRTNKEITGESIYLQPLSELHLAPSFSYPYQTFGSTVLVLSFSVVALLILVIAWVNYINLSTAQALNRRREVGVRKVLGANRLQLVVQYLAETFIITAISV
ncbi:MAG TPA: ABC transporter permease, partial [Chitinophagaceae bacterium]|nr:ABC transporter permease [Chitinophagaceae bacterium]